MIPAEAVARAHGAAAGNARGLLKSYHRSLESGTYGSDEIPHDLTEEDRDQLEDAIVVLHERFPDLEDEGPADPDQEAADRVRAGAAGVRRTRGAPAKSSARGRSSRTRRSGPSSRRRAAAGGFMAGNVIGRRRALRETGVAGVADTTTALALRWIGLLIGLSLAYLILTNASSASAGKSAIELFATGLTGAVRAMILPLDPLRRQDTKTLAVAAKRKPGQITLPRLNLTPAQQQAYNRALHQRKTRGGVPNVIPTG